jgi:hypothetical protein
MSSFKSNSPQIADRRRAVDFPKSRLQQATADTNRLGNVGYRQRQMKIGPHMLDSLPDVTGGRIGRGAV